MMSESMPSWETNPIHNSPQGEVGSYFDLSGVGPGEKTENYESSWNDPKNERFRELVNNAGPQALMVDLGGGLGSTITRMVKEKGISNPKLIMVDLDIRNLREHRDLGAYHPWVTQDAEYVQADGASLPLKDRSTDILVMNYMMADNWVNNGPKKDDIKREILRVLKEDGILIVGPFDYKKLGFQNELTPAATFYVNGRPNELALHRTEININS
jgi:ubiquinone/menaquinone biosynthesis C-methylase UbiE